jgi:hypothetical protein
VQTIWDQITTPVPNGRQVKHHSIVGHATLCGQEEARYDPAARKGKQDEIVSLLDGMNISALTSRASALRGGLPCSVP